MSGRKRRKIISIVSIVGFIASALALLYPVISEQWNNYRNHKLIDSYNLVIQDDSQKITACFKEAAEYNKQLYNSHAQIITNNYNQKNSEYESILNLNEIMGYIDIPKIDITEPIYHYSDTATLDKGIGHIQTSSVPIDDINSHTVLTGHRGLPHHKLFTDVDKLQIGDCFYIHVLDRIFAYKIYDIQTVLPYEVEQLKIEKGKNLVTLVTCTPYGVNSHRLLIMAEKISYDDSNGEQTLSEERHKVIDPAVWVFMGFLSFILISMIISFTVKKIRKNKSKAVLK